MKCTPIIVVNNCVYNFFISIFHPFEAGIANAIYSFIRQKKNTTYENYRHLLDWIILWFHKII